MFFTIYLWLLFMLYFQKTLLELTCKNYGNFGDIVKPNGTDIYVVLNTTKPNNDNDEVEYIISYTHYGYKDCPHRPMNGSKFFAIRNKEITIHDLLPHSEYDVYIKEVGKNYHCIRSFYTIQTDGRDKSIPVELPNITHTQTGTAITVNMNWMCIKLTANLSYDVTITCKSQWCLGERILYSKEEMPYIVNIHFNVLGQASYLLELNLTRHNDSRRTVYPFTSDATEPNEVRNLTVYSVDDKFFNLKWLPPYPPTGNIDYYKIEYGGVLFYKPKIKLVNSSSLCPIWKKYICANITQKFNILKSNNLQVRAKNMHVEKFGPPAKLVLAFDKREVPSPPTNIELVWDSEYNLTVKWQYPDVPNGHITQFLIVISKELWYSYLLDEEQLNYEKIFDLSNLTSRALIIKIAAQNDVGKSDVILKSTQSPPKRPKFSYHPKIRYVNDTSFTIALPKVLDVEGTASYMYIVLTDTSSPDVFRYLHQRDLDLFTQINVEKRHSWIVGQFNLNNFIGDSFSFVVEKSLNTLPDSSNRTLRPGRTYRVTIILNNTFFGFTRYQIYTLYCRHSERNYIYWGLLVLPLLLCIICSITIKRIYSRGCFHINLGRLGTTRGSNIITNISANSFVETTITYHKVEMDEKKFTKIIKIQDLDKYIKGSMENGDFEKQYELFPKGIIKPCERGSKRENIFKNRCSDIIAYDETRVKLEAISEDPFSEYINANYIDGYNLRKAYIATQGPTDATLSDFWRLVWQEKVEYIIVPTRIFVGGKRQFEKYWPEINGYVDFDCIRVVYDKVEVKADYEIRHFRILFDKQERNVQQMQFMNMSEYCRVSLYVYSLASFLKQILSLHQGNSPILVHCSDGIGSTGVVILCDICLRMAIETGKVNVFHELYKLRQQRVNMVKNVNQYKLVHFVLLQILQYLKIPSQTGIVCDETMERKINNVLTVKVQQQMKQLDELSWQGKAMNNIKLKINYPAANCKQRCDNVPRSNRDELPQTSLYTQILINTKIVDSFTTPSRFMVIPNPIDVTLAVVWELIMEKQIKVIVCLNELTILDKTISTFKPLPNLEVTYTDCKINSHYKTYNLTLTKLDKSQTKKEYVSIIHLSNWPADMLHPKNPNDLLMAYDEMNRLEKTTDTILITCHNGIQASGLFVAVCFLIEKIKTDQICDVCLAVKIVRQSWKDFIKDVEQFKFLYLCGLEYVRTFGTYSNFNFTKNN